MFLTGTCVSLLVNWEIESDLTKEESRDSRWLFLEMEMRSESLFGRAVLIHIAPLKKYLEDAFRMSVWMMGTGM